MQAYPLFPHHAKPPLAVRSVEVRVGNDDPDWLQLRWRIDGSDSLVLPKPAGKLKWALYPGTVLLLLGIASLLGVERLINFVGPLVLLAVGGYFVYRALRRGK